MPGRLPISLLSAVAWGNLVNALVPADPTITAPALLPRQNNDRFIGWVEASGTWFSETCQEGLTWYQEGKYAQCCPATLASCYAPTACVSGSLIYPYSDISSTRTIACTENYDNTLFSICNTAFIFENFGDSNPRTDIVCGDQSVNWSYYRKVPATATEPVVSSAAPSSLLPLSGNPAQSGGSSESSSSPSPKKEESKAWIAGAVVGPIAGLALIGGLVFFFLRRRKNKTSAGPQQGSVMAPTDPSQPPAGVGGYTDAKPQMQQQGSFNPNDPYNQNGYGQAPLSPAPQYSSTYSAPGSPPPQQNAYGNDVKYGHATEPTHPGAVEIGGGDVSNAPPAAGASAPPTTNQYTAELPTEAPHNRT